MTFANPKELHANGNHCKGIEGGVKGDIGQNRALSFKEVSEEEAQDKEAS